MSELIPFAKTIKTLTTDSEERKKIHDDYRKQRKKHKLTYTKNTTKYYHVDAKQFYDRIKQKFPELKANIPKKYWPTRCIFSLDQTYDLIASAPIPKFTTLEEAAEIIQNQANEIAALVQENAKLKIKADKWDKWIEKKRKLRKKDLSEKIN